jgi:hypothetical protein
MCLYPTLYFAPGVANVTRGRDAVGGVAMRTASRRFVFSFVLALVSLGPRSAGAVQIHGGAEGLVAHELGHILFAIGLVYILLAVSPARWGRAGRRQYQAFLVLAITWNALTFTGHWLQHSLQLAPVVRATDGVRILVARDGWDWLYYLTYLDHLLLVPALALLVVALRRWRRSEIEAS